MSFNKKQYVLTEEEKRKLEEWKQVEHVKEQFKQDLTEEEKQFAKEIKKEIDSIPSYVEEELRKLLSANILNEDFIKNKEELIQLFSSSASEDEKRLLLILKLVLRNLHDEIKDELQQIKDEILVLKSQINEKASCDDYENTKRKVERIENFLFYTPAKLLLGAGLLGIIIAVLKFIVFGSAEK